MIPVKPAHPIHAMRPRVRKLEQAKQRMAPTRTNTTLQGWLLPSVIDLKAVAIPSIPAPATEVSMSCQEGVQKGVSEGLSERYRMSKGRRTRSEKSVQKV